MSTPGSNGRIVCSDVLLLRLDFPVECSQHWQESKSLKVLGEEDLLTTTHSRDTQAFTSRAPPLLLSRLRFQASTQPFQRYGLLGTCLA